MIDVQMFNGLCACTHGGEPASSLDLPHLKQPLEAFDRP